MPYNMTISPDFKPELISGWYIFNTWLQQKIDTPVHINLVNDFHELSEAIDQNRIDLIYANPYDIARLVREKNFNPLVQPVGSQDETIIVSSVNNQVKTIEELSPGIKVAMTDVPDVNTIGMIMLEPADITHKDIETIHCQNFITVAKNVINGQADIGFLLADAYNEFSNLVKKQLHSLITSKIHVLHHAFLAGPDFPKQEELQQALLSMHEDPQTRKILQNLEIEKWQAIDREEAEFIIDLMDTLSPE